MRKVLAWVLLLTLCLGLFAGCGNQEPQPTEAPTTEPVVEVDPNGAANALAYVKTMYKNAGEKTPKDFTRIGVVPVGDTKYEVVWTADVSEDLVKAVVQENGMVTIDVNEATEEDVPYVLTATVTGVDGKEHSFSWNHLLPAAMSVEDILKDAFALKDGEALPYEVTLTGEVVSIDTPYDDNYKNVTVTIAVEGHEDKAIMCYRLKGDGVDKVVAGNIITVTGTIKNYKGTIEFDAGCVMDKWEEGNPVVMPTDPFEIIDMAYELPRGSSLPAPVTLTGFITSVDTPYSEQYNNITVTIAIPGRLNKPITCYRMKGDDLDKLKTSDEITVTGVIKNYEGTREFDAGCQLVKCVPGSGHTQPKDPVKVVEEAYNLPLAGNLLYDAELTGKITKINTKYSASYGNITVTFVVEGAEDKPIECYRMTGDNSKLAALKVGDTITVKGLIKNYYNFSTNKSKIQYDKPVMLDCILNSTPTEPTVSAMKPVADVKVGTAYKFGFQQNNLSGKPWQMITGEMDGYYGETVTDASMAIDTYIEEANGGYYIYTKKGNTKQYINIVVSGTYYNVKYQATPSSVWTLNTEHKYVKTTCTDGTEVYLGTYGQNSTLGASKTSYISDTSKIGVSQFCAYFLEVDPNGGSTTPDVPGTTVTPELVDAPKTGTAYKFGMVQGNLNKTYFITGEMSSYYMATTEDAAAAADVYLEQTNGGYYLYTTAGGKKYINMVVSGTHVNAAFEDTASTVYTYNAEKKTVTAAVNGEDYWHGTRNDKTYTTVGPVKVSYNGFYCQFYTAGGSTGGETTGTPTVVDTPAVGTAYKFGMLQGNLSKTYFITGEMSSYYMATTEDAATAADVYLEQTNGGYYLYTTAGGKKYINMVVSGTHVNAAFEDTASTVYTYNAEKKTVTAPVNGEDYWHGTRNDKTYTTVGPVKVSYNGFYCQFYTMGGSTGGGTTPDTPDTPDTPTTGDSFVDAPAAETAYKFGVYLTPLGNTNYYVEGTNDAKYLNTTTDETKAIDVYYATSGNGINVYTIKDGTKYYINIIPRETDASKVRVVYQTAAEQTPTVYTMNTQYKYLTTTVNNVEYTLGTYTNSKDGVTYETLSASKSSFLSDPSVIGVTQFPAWFIGTEGTGSNPGGNQGGNTGGSTTMTPEQIVDAAYALAEGESLEGQYTLTGKICYVDTPYSATYKNVTVTIIVGNKTDKAIKCYNLTGTGADVIKIGDTITVTGTLKNYYKTIEFDKGCTLDSYVAGTDTDVAEPTAEIVFNDVSKRTVINDEQQVWVENGITLTNDRSASKNPINAKYYNPIRLYASTAVTVSYTKAMTKIEFVCGTSGYATALKDSIDVAGATVTVVGTTVVVTFSTPVTSLAIANMASQARVASVKVYC